MMRSCICAVRPVTAPHGMPVSVWNETIEHYYPNTAWVALRSQTLEALERRRVDTAHATFDATVADLLGESAGA